jgi:methionyl-tRNA formyltransferase
MKRLRIAFMGTADFSLKALETLHKHKANVIASYSRAPKPAGRNCAMHMSAVHKFADAHGIPIHTPETLRSAEQIEIFRSLKPDLAIVSSYGLIVPQAILDIPIYGFINIHASILPRWRGASPIQAAIMAGDRQSGVTIMKMDSGVDTGDIISIETIDINAKTTHGDIEEQMARLGAKMLIDTLENLKERIAGAIKQPSEGITYAPKVSKSDCRIDWRDPAENVLRRVMAFAPAPAAWSEIDCVRVKILDVDIVSHNRIGASPGEIMADMVVACGDGFIKISKMQPAGKGIMSGSDFLRGRPNFIGKVFS